MYKSKVGKKRDGKGVRKAGFYFALKSQNEIYYQMASILKEVGNDEDKVAKKIFKGFLTDNFSKISLENFL